MCLVTPVVILKNWAPFGHGMGADKKAGFAPAFKCSIMERENFVGDGLKPGGLLTQTLQQARDQPRLGGLGLLVGGAQQLPGERDGLRSRHGIEVATLPGGRQDTVLGGLVEQLEQPRLAEQSQQPVSITLTTGEQALPILCPRGAGDWGASGGQFVDGQRYRQGRGRRGRDQRRLRLAEFQQAAALGRVGRTPPRGQTAVEGLATLLKDPGQQPLECSLAGAEVVVGAQDEADQVLSGKARPILGSDQRGPGDLGVGPGLREQVVGEQTAALPLAAGQRDGQVVGTIIAAAAASTPTAGVAIVRL